MLSSCSFIANTLHKQPPSSLSADAPLNVHFSRCPEGTLAGIGPRAQMFQKQLFSGLPTPWRRLHWNDSLTAGRLLWFLERPGFAFQRRGFYLSPVGSLT